MALARFILIATCSTLVLYALSVSGSAVVYQLLQLDKKLDTGSIGSDLFFGVSGASAVIYNRVPLVAKGPQVILIGASNMLHLRTSDIARELPNMLVHNMSVSGGDVEDFGLIVDLAAEALPPSSHGSRIFVLGIWYGEFVKVRDKEPGALDTELTRYGFYEKSEGDRVSLALAQPALPYALAAVRPLVFTRRLWGTFTTVATSTIKGLLGESHPLALDTLATETASLDETEKKNLINQRLYTDKKANDRVSDDALATLVQISKRVSDTGDRLVLVDLPIPLWHAEAVPAYADYVKRRRAYIEEALRLPGVQYADMQGSVPDAAFYDSVHLRPSAGADLAHRLGRVIGGMQGWKAQLGAR